MRKYLAVAALAIRERLTYRVDLVAGSLFMVLFLFIFSQLWSTVFRGGLSFEGLDGRAVVWYVVVTEAVMMGSPPLGRRIADEVRSGSFATSLLRPANYVLMHMASFFGEALVTVSANLVAGSLVALSLVGSPPPVTITSLTVAAVAIVLGLLLNFLVTASVALLAFWVEDNEPFFWILNKFQLILGGVLIPLDFFPGLLRTVASHLPFAYTFYGPARLTVAFSGAQARGIITGQLLWIAVAAVVTASIHRRGVRQVNVNGG